MDTSGLAVSGHVGTWHTIDHMEVDGHIFFLMEHDSYGDEAACLIVDEHGKLSLSDVYDGFDEHTVDLLRQEVMPVDRMPDPSITTDEMKDYGYAWGGMLPMREEAAVEVMKPVLSTGCTVIIPRGWFWMQRKSTIMLQRMVSSVWKRSSGRPRWNGRTI